jgi:DNA-binding phage protein
MRGTRLRKWMLCGLLGAMLLATVGCEDRAALIELGARFLPEIGMYKAFGSTGDASLDAILQAREMLNNIGHADALMDQAWEEGDPALMEEAIALRPYDWTYRVDAASMNLAQNDLRTAERHLTAAENVLPDDPDAHLAHSLQVIEQFEAIKASGDEEGYTSVEQCHMVHDQLVRNYNRQWSLTGNEGLSPAGQQIADDQVHCAERVQP